jgi:hypothetical protein
MLSTVFFESNQEFGILKYTLQKIPIIRGCRNSGQGVQMPRFLGIYRTIDGNVFDDARWQLSFGLSLKLG